MTRLLPALVFSCFVFGCAPTQPPGNSRSSLALPCADACEDCVPCTIDALHVESSVVAGTDDAEEEDGFMYLTSSDLELTEDQIVQIVGVRFPAVNIPAGVTIVNATVQFTTDEVSTAGANLRIRGEASPDAAPFSKLSHDISQRPATASEVSWIPAPWPAVGEAGVDQQTPNLAAIVQEIVNRPDWVPGGAVAIIIDGTGRRTADSAESGTGPFLHVDYVTEVVDPECGDGTCNGTEDCGSCSADCGPCPTCGDGTCNGTEDCSTCESDCGACGAETTIEIGIAGPDDDVEEQNGFVSRGSSDLELTETGVNQIVGIRFDGLQIPTDATIISATVQFTVDETSSGDTNLSIRGHRTDDAPSFSSTDFDVSNRPVTAANVDWAPPPWTVVGAAGLGQRTTNLASVVQEIVSRPGWQEGNALALIITGTGVRTAESFESGPAARLRVTFSSEPAVCGDGTCNGTEDCGSCPADCGPCPTCGDGTCNGTENCSTCESDCGTCAAETTFEIGIAGPDDDVEEQNGFVSRGSSDLELTETGVNQIVGIRFDGLQIPTDATIISATVQFTVDETSSGDTNLSIRGHRTDDAPSFSSTDFDVSNRPVTAANVDWAPPPWTVVGAASLDQRTTNLASVVQEIVSRPGWREGNALALIITGTGVRTAESFEGGPAARLRVTFSSEPAVCGDGTCSGSERCGSCPTDCGECPSHGGSSGIDPDPITHIDCDAASPTLTVCASGADHTSIQAAIDAAPTGARIDVCPGTYSETLSIGRSLCLVGTSGASSTTIRGNGSSTAVTASGASGLGVSIEGFTVENGATSTRGGGLYCSGSVLRLDSMIFTANSAGDDGGGFSLDDCNATVTSSEVFGNTAGDEGGGVHLFDSNGWLLNSSVHNNTAFDGAGIASTDGTFSIERNNIFSNTATNLGGGVYHRTDANFIDNAVENNHSAYRGGGLCIINHAPLIESNLVRGNTVDDDGAGVFLEISTATLVFNTIEANIAADDAGGLRLFQSNAHIEGNVIRGNHCTDAGGGVKASHAQNIFIGNTIENNSATLGGGIELDDDSSTIQRCVFRNNQAARGGAIHGLRIPNAFIIESSILENNTATEAGGAIDLEDSQQPGTLRFLTIVGNEAPMGAAISTRFTFPGIPITITSSILFDNVGEFTLGDEGSDEPFFAYNDIFPAPTVTGMPAPSSSDGNLFVDPQFVDASSSDYHLQPGSQCIDTGDPGELDPDGSAADMGAYGGPEAL